MKALCVQQPYAAFIAAAYKTIELRTWQTHYRGDLLIVASGSPRRDMLSFYQDELQHANIAPHVAYGVAICKVSLVDVRPARKKDRSAALKDDPRGLYAWVLENPTPVRHRRIKGRLNLFDV